MKKSDKFDQLELLVESCVKSIRQMQTIRRYRDGLNEVLNDVTTLYQDQNPQQLIAAIVGQVRSFMSGRRCLRDAQSAEYSRLQRKRCRWFPRCY